MKDKRDTYTKLIDYFGSAVFSTAYDPLFAMQYLWSMLAFVDFTRVALVFCLYHRNTHTEVSGRLLGETSNNK